MSLKEPNKVCAAVTHEPVLSRKKKRSRDSTCCTQPRNHGCEWTCMGAGCAVMQKCFYFHVCPQLVRLTGCVTRGWVGRDNAALPEPASSHGNCSKTRRLPPVGCTLCWALFAFQNLFSHNNLNSQTEIVST